MDDLLVDVVTDGHTAIRSVILTATLIATGLLMLTADGQEKAAR